MYLTLEVLPLASLTTNEYVPFLVPALTVTLTDNDVPVSLKTFAVVPACVLVIVGRPENAVPTMVIIVVLPATTNPTTLTALNGLTKVTVVAADETARLVVDAAL